MRVEKPFISSIPCLLLAICFGLCACDDHVTDDDDDIIQILLNNDYAVRFDDMWEVLDMYYPFFDYIDADFDSLRVTTIKRMKNVSSDEQFARVVQQFCKEMGEPDIYFTAGDSLYKGYSIATQDCQAILAGEQGAFASYSASGNSNIQTEWCAFNTLLRSTDDSAIVYGLMLPLYYTKAYLPKEQVEQLKQFILSHSDIQGLVLDIRNRDIMTSITILLPYFYEQGRHVVCTYNERAAIDENIPLSQQRDSLSKTYECTTIGNGLLSDMPIAIIVNEATSGEYAWLAHVLAERDNVAIISRTYGGGGSQKYNMYHGKQHIISPCIRSVTANYVCYEPLQPDIPVNWEGYGANLYNPYTEDMCIGAALDFIDNNNIAPIGQ